MDYYKSKPEFGPNCLILSSPHLQWKRWLFIVDSDKNLTHYELLAVITEQKLSTKAFIIFSLPRNQRSCVIHSSFGSFIVKGSLKALVSHSYPFDVSLLLTL